MNKQPIITRLTAFCDATINGNNILTEQENETLMTLMRKCVAATPEYCKATNEEEAERCKVFVNSIDDGFGDAAADILAETCTTLATAIGKMISDNIAEMMKSEEVEEPSTEMLNDAMNKTFKEYGLPQDLLSKSLILGLFVFNTIEDPLVAILNGHKCLEIGEKISVDAIKISAKFTHEIMNP